MNHVPQFVDLAFRLRGTELPVDHGYLFLPRSQGALRPSTRLLTGRPCLAGDPMVTWRAWGIPVRCGAGMVALQTLLFVATTSITQGEQVAQLWPVLFNRLDGREAVRSAKRLFSYPDIKGDPEETRHAALSPYLFDASGLADPHLTVREESRPINDMKKLITGTQPLENGNLTFSSEGKSAFLVREPDAEPYFRPFPGSREFIRRQDRWILHTADIPPQELRKLSMVRERLRAVRSFRAQSKRIATKRLADFPRSYGVTVVPEHPFLIIPQVSSERRDYVPIGWLEPPVIPSEKLRPILTSAMHMAWMRTVTESSTTLSRCPPPTLTCPSSSPWQRPSSTLALLIPMPPWRTFTTRI